MTTLRRSPKKTFSDVENAYQSFLHETCITLPAAAAFICGIIIKTGIVVNSDGTPKRSDLYDGIGLVAVVLLPVAFTVLAFTRGRSQLLTIAFGRLNSWQIVLLGVVLGAFAQISSRAIFASVGGSVVSANDDPSVIGTITYFLYFVLLVPINEEVMFRVVLQTYLQRYGTAVALVGTTLLFTMFHFDFFDRIPSHDQVIATLALISPHALIFSVARRYSGSLLLNLVIHMIDSCLAIVGSADVRLPGCC